MATRDYARAVDAHYGSGDLGATILSALRAAGKDPGHLAPADLAPVDQFHIGGRQATMDLAGLAGIAPGTTVLDVGGGLGGAARTLAAEFGCAVTVLDLTAEFCRVGALLTAHTGLDGRVTFRQGDALAMPFPDESFDAVWTQHSSMNIADKARLYAEIRRVLRPGGRLALHEVVAGPVQPIHFPVPWADDPSLSHLSRPEEIRALLLDAGFAEVAWVDVTASAVAWFRAWATTTTPGPLGMHLLMGDGAREKGRNQVRNLEEGRAGVVQGVFSR
ncbi:MAG TPA: methyltransferase domain-containing protein [Thermomicrobiales bacterium]|nr:methyltransferase domain-containing protein [Thermomicrobiales bacterium]